ncbi:hypothetical protein NQ318_003527 [Aromia moschata]|uniref:Uncharacterized protein n=1 Tax=Aromia moschata TaxID=1265417 RepID=A0AAV8YVB9_9CUCU|nr:hypothetical protein NQ318_003527 [Aromia moschata]
MGGMVNITLPYKSLNYTGAYFSTETNAGAYNRYVKIFWDGDNAILDSKCDIKIGATLLERNMKGVLVAELPLTTRHRAVIDYEYDKKAEVSVGHATVSYNNDNVLQGKYRCVTEARAGFEKDTTHVELDNTMLPVGADYIHRREYDVPREGYNTPGVELTT